MQQPKAAAQGSRSTVLRPLGWLASICVAAILGGVGFGAPVWLIILLAILFGFSVAFYLAAYAYCLLTGKTELLRSETYSIQKLAIEKGFVGDSLTGVFQEPVDQVARLLEPGHAGETGK